MMKHHERITTTVKYRHSNPCVCVYQYHRIPAEGVCVCPQVCVSPTSDQQCGEKERENGKDRWPGVCVCVMRLENPEVPPVGLHTTTCMGSHPAWTLCCKSFVPLPYIPSLSVPHTHTHTQTNTLTHIHTHLHTYIHTLYHSHTADMP